MNGINNDEEIDFQLGVALRLCWETMKNHRAQLEPNIVHKDKWLVGHFFDKRPDYFYVDSLLGKNGPYYTDWPDYLDVKASHLEYSEKKYILDDCREWLSRLGIEIPEAPSDWDFLERADKKTIEAGIAKGKGLIGSNVTYGTSGRVFDKDHVITGASTTMDCISLISYMYGTPDKWQAYNNSGPVPFSENPYFMKIQKDSLQRGDLIVWDYLELGKHYGHVVVYLGGDDKNNIIESTEWTTNGKRHSGIRTASLWHYEHVFFKKTATLKATGYYRLKTKTSDEILSEENTQDLITGATFRGVTDE